MSADNKNLPFTFRTTDPDEGQNYLSLKDAKIEIKNVQMEYKDNRLVAPISEEVLEELREKHSKITEELSEYEDDLNMTLDIDEGFLDFFVYEPTKKIYKIGYDNRSSYPTKIFEMNEDNEAVPYGGSKVAIHEKEFETKFNEQFEALSTKVKEKYGDDEEKLSMLKENLETKLREKYTVMGQHKSTYWYGVELPDSFIFEVLKPGCVVNFVLKFDLLQYVSMNKLRYKLKAESITIVKRGRDISESLDLFNEEESVPEGLNAHKLDGSADVMVAEPYDSKNVKGVATSRIQVNDKLTYFQFPYSSASYGLEKGYEDPKKNISATNRALKLSFKKDSMTEDQEKFIKTLQEIQKEVNELGIGRNKSFAKTTADMRKAYAAKKGKKKTVPKRRVDDLSYYFIPLVFEDGDYVNVKFNISQVDEELNLRFPVYEDGVLVEDPSFLLNDKDGSNSEFKNYWFSPIVQLSAYYKKDFGISAKIMQLNIKRKPAYDKKDSSASATKDVSEFDFESLVEDLDTLTSVV